ncbi:MAG: RNA-directed DNA polymerase [Acidobacteriota bacterium]
MIQCEAHFKETEKLARQIIPADLAKWLLYHGYYPEQYVLPPPFTIQKFDLCSEPYFKVSPKKKSKFIPDISVLETIAFPKSPLTVRAFGIIEPHIYHDLTFHISREWPTILDCIFNNNLRIYSYSFPIPVTRTKPGRLGRLRAGRMIYEFIEMAENDLVGEAHKYKYLFKTDVSNFYATIYTHSIAWALHGKQPARDDRGYFRLLGSIIDKLFQSANDGRTNGIAVGPAICDLISEVVLAAIDRRCSEILTQHNLDFVGARFKDDYRFLCRSEEDVQIIARALQKSLGEYNLAINEGKSEISNLPEGMFRAWKSSYQHWSLRYERIINYRSFETTLLSVLRIDEQYPGGGIIDSFLSELTTRKFGLKLDLNESEARKAYSLLLLLKQRRAKSFPSILAIVEAVLNNYGSYHVFREYVANSLSEMLERLSGEPDENEYDIIWTFYFLSVVLGRADTKLPSSTNQVVRSILTGSQCFHDGQKDSVLFKMITHPAPMNHLLKHLAVFHRNKTSDAQGNPGQC